MKAKAKEAGQKVLPDSEVKKLFPYGTHLSYDSKYIDLDGTAYLQKGEKKIASLIKAPKEAVVLARDAEGNVRHLLEKEVGRDLLKEASKEAKDALGHQLGARSSGASSGTSPSSTYDLKHKVDKEVARRVNQAILDAVERKKGFDDLFIRLLVRGVAKVVWAESAKVTAERRGFEMPTKTVLRDGVYMNPGVKALIDGAEHLSGPSLVALLVEPLAYQEDDFRKAAAELLGVDVAMIRQVCMGEMKAKRKEIAARKAKRAKKEKAEAKADAKLGTGKLARKAT